MAYRSTTVSASLLQASRLFWVRAQVLASLDAADEPTPPEVRWDWQSAYTTSTVRWHEQATSWLQSRCDFRQPERVKDFFRRHPVVLELLQEAYPVLRRYFGLRPLLAAEVVTDMESEDADGDSVLFVYIRTALDPDEALAELDGFDSDWFLDRVDRAGGRLNFNLEFL